MHEAEKLSLGQIQAFLNASETIRFEGETQAQIYHWIEQVLGRQEYHQQSRPARGLLRNYVAKMTGLSRAQVTRLIARYRKSGSLKSAPYRRHRFPQRYTRADVELLAIVDEAHDNLSGPATRRILEREYRQYGKCEFKRLASLSVSHLYNLRQQPRYRERRRHYVKTRPTAVAIGERRRPDPRGQPGYLRVDTVHQGDPPGSKGVYHIDAVDEVTQWQIVSASARISEAWLEPVLEAMLRQFPVIDALASGRIALMHGVDTKIPGLAARIGPPPFSDGHGGGPRLDVVPTPFAIARLLAEVVEVRHRQRG